MPFVAWQFQSTEARFTQVIGAPNPIMRDISLSMKRRVTVMHNSRPNEPIPDPEIDEVHAIRTPTGVYSLARVC